VISLYFHIPFCTKKCPYCHFYVIPNRAPFRKILSDGLALEWERQWPLIADKTVTSIYFGGGTPTLFGTEGIGALLDRIRASGLQLAPDCEITLEANPEDSSFELFAALRSLGVNRLSLGVQSLDDRSLIQLERIHSAKRAKQALFDAQRAGFTNISIDLMYDLPEQTEESWRHTLDQLADLPIQHLSLYNLTIEPHTAFFKRKVQVPTGELSLRFLHAALEHLEKIGLKRYEISAFCKEGFASRHNLGYWTGRPFLGFGPSAFSYWEGERFRNIAHLQRYNRLLKEGASPVDFRESLPYPANVKELLAVRLRLREGVLIEPFPEETEGAIEKLKRDRLLFEEGSRLRLTERGMLFYDTVAAEII
jgi:oxygen-independent coproporphyrinogen-3 oxidase